MTIIAGYGTADERQLTVEQQREVWNALIVQRARYQAEAKKGHDIAARLANGRRPEEAAAWTYGAQRFDELAAGLTTLIEVFK